MASAPGTPARLRGWAWQERWLVVIVLLALALGLALGYRYAHYEMRARDAITPEHAAALGARMARAEAESRQLRSRLDIVGGELAVEQGARKGLEQQLQAAQGELGRLRDQLAFFEQLLPPGPQGSLDIRAVGFERQGAALRYRVLLMRNPGNGSAFEGRLQFMAAGVREGRRVTLELLPLRVREDGSVAPPSEADKELLGLRFDQYQRSLGLLAVPAGFVPRTVTVRVLEGDAVRAMRSVDIEF